MHVQATSYLVTAWEALAAQQETTMDELPVTFEDVSIVQAVQAQPGENVTLSVTLDRSHRFQVPSSLMKHNPVEEPSMHKMQNTSSLSVSAEPTTLAVTAPSTI